MGFWRYAAGNPVTYIDPSGRDAASEYAFNLGLKLGPEITGALADAAAVACVYYAEASAIDLVNQFTPTTETCQWRRLRSETRFTRATEQRAIRSCGRSSR